MSPIVIAGLCGFAGGVIAILGALAVFMRQLKHKESVTFSRGPGPELYRNVEVLEHAPRPQGRYVHFRNTGTKPIEMVHFKVRGYVEGKLWAEFEESVYSETQPGAEQEAILQLQDYRDRSKSFDLSNCRVEVKVLYGYVAARRLA